MIKKYLKFIILLSVVCFLLSGVLINAVLAYDCSRPGNENTIWANMERCRACGDCELSHFTRLAVNVAQFILGITGSLALLAFVYGGVMFLISAGNTERVTKAKTIIMSAVIGIIIVFAAYTIIGFVFKAMGAETTGAWSKTNWFQ